MCHTAVNHRIYQMATTFLQVYICWYCKDQVGLAEWCLLLAGEGLRKYLKFSFWVFFFPFLSQPSIHVLFEDDHCLTPLTAE